jgi:hypothetical protein
MWFSERVLSKNHADSSENAPGSPITAIAPADEQNGVCECHYDS